MASINAVLNSDIEIIGDWTFFKKSTTNEYLSLLSLFNTESGDDIVINLGGARQPGVTDRPQYFFQVAPATGASVVVALSGNGNTVPLTNTLWFSDSSGEPYFKIGDLVFDAGESGWFPNESFVVEEEKTVYLQYGGDGYLKVPLNLNEVPSAQIQIIANTPERIGNFLITEGTENGDFYTVTPGEAYFGMTGGDSLWVTQSTFLEFEGRNWWIPAIANGGSGNDQYYIGVGTSAFISDASPDSGDSLRIYDYASNITEFFSIEGRHLFFATTLGTSILVIDALNANGAIEEIRFSDISLSGDVDSSTSLLQTYQTRGDQTIEQLISQDLLNPKIMGIKSANEVRQLIDSIYPLYQYDNQTGVGGLVDGLVDKYGSTHLTDPAFRILIEIEQATWSDSIVLNRVVQAAVGGATIEAKQTDQGRIGSVLRGSDNNDRLLGRAGWDIFDGRGGNDFIRGGNGRDIITGGLGNDELHGDLGWNTYTSEKDGSADLIVIKSDQFLFNPLLGKAGNNLNGAKCDIIEGLDTIDRIRILGVRSSDISIQDNVTAKGVTGIGIYGGGYLEALYIGGDLTVDQITAMTSGDASPAAMANQISSYGWKENPGVLADEFTSENPASAIVPDYITGESVSSSVEPDDVSILAKASTWSGSIRINRIAQAAANGGEINAVQTYDGGVGSVLLGSNRNDVLRGRAGWDIFDGRGGNDFIRGGNGRDIITGGLDSDELWGDLGWNTYTSEKDGSADLIVIKSDQFLFNPLLGKAGNNSDGAKCDIIEGLDSIDRIRILGVSTQDLTFRNDVTAKGVTGIGIYGGGYLEALYIGSDLTLSQIASMTSGDASPAAMDNQISSYGWTENPGVI